jgi:hypothetical protein
MYPYSVQGSLGAGPMYPYSVQGPLGVGPPAPACALGRRAAHALALCETVFMLVARCRL